MQGGSSLEHKRLQEEDTMQRSRARGRANCRTSKLKIACAWEDDPGLYYVVSYGSVQCTRHWGAEEHGAIWL
jgi:hypothetical protein